MSSKIDIKLYTPHTETRFITTLEHRKAFKTTILIYLGSPFNLHLAKVRFTRTQLARDTILYVDTI